MRRVYNAAGQTDCASRSPSRLLPRAGAMRASSIRVANCSCANARRVPPELPQLIGPDGGESQVAQRYLAAQGRLIECGLRLAALRLDARGAWQLDLSNGISVRLRPPPGRRSLRSLHPAQPCRPLPGVRKTVAYVDMRYSNGFAVGWKRGRRRTD